MRKGERRERRDGPHTPRLLAQKGARGGIRRVVGIRSVAQLDRISQMGMCVCVYLAVAGSSRSGRREWVGGCVVAGGEREQEQEREREGWRQGRGAVCERAAGRQKASLCLTRRTTGL